MRRWIGGLVTLAVLVAAWWWIWPTQLAGRTTYAVTHGVSMLPRFHTGDLAVVRPADRYEIGDVVAYYSPTIKSVTLHRIVERDGNGFITKGDNNTWIDPDRPTAQDMLGVLQFRVPKGGTVMQAVTQPLPLAAIIGVILLLTGKQAARRGRRRAGTRRAPSPGFSLTRLAPSQVPTPVLAAVVTGGAALAAIGVAAVLQPATVPVTRQAPVEQTATISYAGQVAAGPVYPSGTLGTGDPIFRRLVDAIDLRVDLTTNAPALSDPAGTAKVVAKIDSNYGWRHEITLVPEHRFTGGDARTTARLDLAAYQRLIDSVQGATGVVGTYTLTVRTDIETTGTVQGRQVTRGFSPSVAFDLGRDQVKLTTPGAAGGAPTGGDATAAGEPAAEPPRGSAGITVRDSAPVSWADTEAGTMRLRGWSVQVGLARQLGAIGAALLAGCGAWWLVARRRQQNQPETTTIVRRFGERIIPVATVTAPDGRTVVEITSIESLAKIAERYERYILHSSGDAGEHFRVEDDTTLYLYRPDTPPALSR